MKKFSQIDKRKPVKKINEQEETQEVVDANANKDQEDQKDEHPVVPNLPENIQGQEKENIGTDAVKLFSKLFESREIAHIFHLQVKGDPGSYAAHMALGEYYEGVLDLIDDLIETYQGQYGTVEGYDTIDTKNEKGHVEYFEELAQIIKSERKCISTEDTHLHNIIDEVVALTYKTLFKLKYNK